MSTKKQNAKRMISEAHGATGFDQPIGASWNSPVGWKKNKSDITVCNEAICIDDVDLTGQVKFQGLAVPITPGTQDDLVLVCEQFDSNPATITLPDMIAGSSGFDAMGAIYYQTQDFKYQGSDLMPIEVELS